MTKISIITPSFNQGSFITQTIESVVAQDISNLDYLIIDGGSTDNSVEIIKSYKDALSYWVSEPDHGQSHAINKGLKKAQGGIINWLNSDDYYEPNTLQIVGAAFQKGVTGVGGKSRLFNQNGTLKISRGTDIYPNNVAKTIGWARIDQPETFFSKEALDQVGPLNEALHYCMDREWWMRYLYIFGLEGFEKIDDVLVNFRIHDSSKTETAQSGFEREHHSLFYQMGLVVNQREAVAFMIEHLDINPELTTAISTWVPSELVIKSFNYYLLLTAEQYYQSLDFSKAQKMLSFVQTDWLEVADRQLVTKLQRRLKLPKGLVKWLRKN